MNRTDGTAAAAAATASQRTRLANEAAGACGDLGTLLPHAIGAITIGALAPAGVLFGFGAAFVASGLFYGLPMAVQPMKAVSAVLIAGQLDPQSVAATGLIIGAVMLALGATGAIGRLARLIPQSVTAGLQLGLGLLMAWLGLGLVLQAWWLGVAALALLVLVPRWAPALPTAALVVVAATGVGLATGMTEAPALPLPGLHLPPLVLPGDLDAVWRAVSVAVVPQLPLTLTNAVIVTAIVCGELFPARATRATPRNLALTTGAMNLVLAPLGAMPMCHGAGGVVAQHRFGARTGRAPVLLGLVLLALAICFADSAAALLAAIPAPAVGALLLVAGADLALSRRLFDARAVCWPAIAVAAAATALVNPALGLAAGWAVELVREAVARHRLAARRP